jgi:hypothetical protein
MVPTLRIAFHVKRQNALGFWVSLIVTLGLSACESPFASPNSDLFKTCSDVSASGSEDTSPMITRFLADKEKQTVLVEYWVNPRERPKDIDSLPLTNCTVHDERHWSCSFNGEFFSTSYSRSGDIVRSNHDQPNKGESRFSTSCYEKIQ